MSKESRYSDEIYNMAKEALEQLSKERELLVAKFIVENPDIKASDIVLVQQTGLNCETRIWVEKK